MTAAEKYPEPTPETLNQPVQLVLYPAKHKENLNLNLLVGLIDSTFKKDPPVIGFQIVKEKRKEVEKPVLMARPTYELKVREASVRKVFKVYSLLGKDKEDAPQIAAFNAIYPKIEAEAMEMRAGKIVDIVVSLEDNPAIEFFNVYRETADRTYRLQANTMQRAAALMIDKYTEPTSGI